ncbi:DUF3304 domain-containing protein [Variovorax sp. J2P1-59]|uniref:DUF3304 domain-containing protein n=1 Tax=Variovorax flavidus TaxID=3053501 RepID=UPI002577D5F2|nr:DUF3304 domain-containing protein [Variovorax sp. J2P1-59]MDM0075018.1 DUF3304 domain-containing protein [Variovorax sp. J2P1-59]
MKNSSFRPFTLAVVKRLLWGLLLGCLLASCAAPGDFGDFSSTSKSGVKKSGVAIVGVNHSQTDIAYFGLATGGGGGYVDKRWPSSGTSCCAVIPDIWTPGLDVRVDWQPSLQEERSKRIAIERYEKIGTVYVHFFDNDEIKIVVANVGAEHPDHPITWIPLPCERSFKPSDDGRLLYEPGVNCPPRATRQ